MSEMTAPGHFSLLACREACPDCPLANQDRPVKQALGKIIGSTTAELWVDPLDADKRVERYYAATEALQEYGGNPAAAMMVIKAAGMIARLECDQARFFVESVGGD